MQKTIGTEIVENNAPNIDTTESYIEADFDVVYVLNISKEELYSYVESSKINADKAIDASVNAANSEALVKAYSENAQKAANTATLMAEKTEDAKAIVENKISMATDLQNKAIEASITAENTYKADLGLKVYGKSTQKTTQGNQLIGDFCTISWQNWSTVSIVNPSAAFYDREWYIDGITDMGNGNTGIFISKFKTGFKRGEIYTYSGYIKGNFNIENPFRLITFYTNLNGELWSNSGVLDFRGVSHIDEYTRYSLTFKVKDDFDESVNRVVLVFANLGGQFYLTKPMLQSGDTLTDYETYTGGIPSPNPEYPQAINSIGDSGSIDVVVSDSNGNSQTLTINTPNGLCGIPVNTGGNYTDESGQQWICDEIDFERGVYIQRIGKILSYNAEVITTKYMSTTGELTSEATVIYILQTPIETPLSENLLQAYRAIKSCPHYTRIESAAELIVKLKSF